MRMQLDKIYEEFYKNTIINFRLPKAKIKESQKD